MLATEDSDALGLSKLVHMLRARRHGNSSLSAAEPVDSANSLACMLPVQSGGGAAMAGEPLPRHPSKTGGVSGPHKG